MAEVRVRQPFDAVASDYDRLFTEQPIGRWQRGLIHAQLAKLCSPGQRVLELGCGTGEDALWLARRGALVTATDSSLAMLEVARRKLAQHGRSADFAPVDIAQPAGPAAWEGAFDGALSNFGALNCVADLRPVAAALARWVRPGGWLALVLIGPLCAWEIVWHLLRGRPRTALRRLRPGGPAAVGPDAAVRIWYPTPGKLAHCFDADFQHVATFGVGTLLPPPYLGRFVRRYPRLGETLALLDRRLAPTRLAGRISDHYLAIFERRAS